VKGREGGEREEKPDGKKKERGYQATADRPGQEQAKREMVEPNEEERERTSVECEPLPAF